MDASEKISRTFLPKGFSFTTWSELEPFFRDLDERVLTDEQSVKNWLRDLSELEAFFYEDMAWRYIRMSTDTENEKHREAYHFFVNEIHPKSAPFFDRYNRKLAAAPAVESLRKDRAYDILMRNTQIAIDIFREENIALESEMATRSQAYGAIAGKMSITFKGKEYTLPQATVLLESTDRNEREQVFLKIADRRMQEKDALDELMDDLVKIRHRIAVNADYDNFRDYKFDDLKRFDYTPEDSFRFHNSVEEVILPVVREIHEERKKALGLDKLKLYDLNVDFRGDEPLRPFRDSKELLSKGVEVMSRVHPFFGECITTMEKMGHLDLESRSGKAPGGYNYPLYESGFPFIFMNAAGTQNDLMTFVHEAGHAVHSVLTQEQELVVFKNCPSEVAELASMSMELISMQHWNVFYDDPEDFRRAQLDQLERAVSSLNWIATIDCFQHWLYENPTHTREERAVEWRKIYTRFQGDLDWEGMESYRDHFWQKQLHLFELPFYYIEYGIAQLGAIAVYRNFVEDPDKALERYINALKLGNSRSIPEIYEAAGIRFDFSAEYIRELADFVSAQIKKLQK